MSTNSIKCKCIFCLISHLLSVPVISQFVQLGKTFFSLALSIAEKDKKKKPLNNYCFNDWVNPVS